MKKRTAFLILLCLLFCLVFTSCEMKNTAIFCRHEIGASSMFTKEEISTLMKQMEKEFTGAKNSARITALKYNEAESRTYFKGNESYAQYPEDCRVMLLLSFHTSLFGKQMVLIPNSDYTESWVFVRRTKDASWELLGHGFG